MKHLCRRTICAALILALLLTLTGTSFAADTRATLTATAEARNIQKYGNVTLSLTCEEIRAAGYAYGDVLTVRFLDKTMELPLCSNFSDVDSGSPGIFARAQDEYVLAAINMGDFATTFGIAVKTTHPDKTFDWDYADGVTGPVTFTISCKEAGGYYGEYLLHQLSYTHARSDYAGLTDAQFANFRNVHTPGMGYGTLYRTSSPVNPKFGRSAYADAALREAGVTVVMNLEDDEAAVRGYEGYEASYYASTNYIALNIGVDFTAADFRARLAEGLRFFAENPGVYAVHCSLGKDRAGFVCAVLEAFMGADYASIVGDYMTTFYNYYGVVPTDTRYKSIAESNIVRTLSRAFGVSDLESADLKACAEKYIRSLGLNDAEIEALRGNLAADHMRDTAFFTPQEHSKLNYDEIQYERIAAEPLLEEIGALRALCAEAGNETAFRTRFLALADEIERMGAMTFILQNRMYADGEDKWAASEFETSSEAYLTVSDAFYGLIRDALLSPCADALDGLLSERMRKTRLNYSDLSEEGKELLRQETALVNEYMSAVNGAFTATVDGKTYTIDSAAQAYLDGEMTYDEYSEIYEDCFKAANTVLGELFVKMVALRNRIAEEQGYDTYAEYAYETIYSRDYGPEDAQAFCDAVKQYIVPKYDAYRLLTQTVEQSEMPEGAAYSGEGMFETLLPYFARLSDELTESARYTYEHRAFDVEPSPNKVSTGYSAVMPYYRIPFYFNNSSGTWTDLTATIHELGHNNEGYWIKRGWNAAESAIDVREVHSQALELLMLRFYPELFGSQTYAAETDIVFRMLGSVVKSCLYDEWERRVYETPELTLEKANRLFRQLCGEYGLVAADDARGEMIGWVGIPHLFDAPMYVISYATSAAGAFAFWEASQEDYYAAVDDYLRYTALGGETGFEDSFLAVGMESPLSEHYLPDLADMIHARLLPVRPYTDVYADSWYGEAVIFADDFALMNGVASDRFAPEADALREQSMTILARIADGREDADAPYTLDEGVAWAIDNGISDGNERGATLTREQFAAMLYRFAQAQELETDAEGSLSGFPDADSVSGWAADAMSWAVGAEIIGGMGDGTLSPQENVSRAQLAVMLMRFSEFEQRAA